MTPFREIGRSVGATVLETIGRATSRLQESRPIASDLLESDDAYLVVFDAPGATASDVQVRYKDGAVLVRIDRFRDFREGFEMRFPGRGLSLDGRAELPDDAMVRPDRASARLRENGSLVVEVPKHDRDVSEVDETVDEVSRSDETDVDVGAGQTSSVEGTDDQATSGDDGERGESTEE